MLMFVLGDHCNDSMLKRGTKEESNEQFNIANKESINSNQPNLASFGWL